MKRKLLSTIILSAMLYTANGQWIEQATGFLATSRGIWDISAVDQNVVWALGYDGSGAGTNSIDFTRTVDGGNLWVAGTVGSDTAYGWSNLIALSDSDAWVCMYDQTLSAAGGLWYTHDAGVTWTQSGAGVIFDANSFPNFVHFQTDSIGFALGDPNGPGVVFYEIYTTTDAGATWVRTPTANIPAPLSNEACIVNDFTVLGNTIWAGTSKSRVMRSTDYGLNWTAASVPGTVGTITDIAFRDQNNGLCIKSVGTTTFTYTLYSTTDGGNTWVNIPTPAGWFNQNVINIPGTNTYMSSSLSFNPPGAGGTSYSLDDGQTWTIIIDSIQMGALEFVDDVTGWAGGFNQDAITGGIFKWDFGPVSAHETSVKKELMTAYPNPTNDFVRLVMNLDKRSEVKITITNTLGQVVYSKNEKSATGQLNHVVNVADWNSGLYFATVEWNGNKVQQKIVVQ